MPLTNFHLLFSPPPIVLIIHWLNAAITSSPEQQIQNKDFLNDETDRVDQTAVNMRIVGRAAAYSLTGGTSNAPAFSKPLIMPLRGKKISSTGC